MDIERLVLEESLGLARIKKTFLPFFNEVGTGVLDNIINILVRFTRYMSLAVETKISNETNEEIFKYLNLFNIPSEKDITKDLIMSEFPNVYMEQIISELRKIYKTRSMTKDDFLKELISLEEITYNEWKTAENPILNLIRNYVIFFYTKLFIKKNGLNYLDQEIITKQKRAVAAGNYNVLNDIIDSIIIKAIIERIYREKHNKMRNRKVYEDDEVEIYKVDDSREACIALGKGTDWCVANTHTDSHYKEYSSMGDMYAFVFKNIKSNFDPSLPEKALLTIKNKVSKENIISDDILELIKAVQNEKYDLSYKIHSKQQVSENIHDAIKELFNDPLLEKYKTLFNSFKNSIDDIYKLSILETLKYMVKIYEDVFTNAVASPPKTNLITAYKNNYYNQFFDVIYQSFLKVYFDFLEKALNFKEFEKSFNKDRFGSFKEFAETFFQIKEKYPWIMKYYEKDSLSITPSIQLKLSDGSTKNLTYNELRDIFVQNMFKYPIIFQDSGNININLFNPSSENHKVIARKFFDWQKTQQNILNVSVEVFNSVKEKMLNIRTHSVNSIDSIDDPIINFVKNDMANLFSNNNYSLKRYYTILEFINTDNETVYFLRMYNTNTVIREVPSNLISRLKELVNGFYNSDLIWPVLATCFKNIELIHSSITGVLNIFLDFEFYLSLLKDNEAEELKQTVAKVKNTFYKNTLASWINASTVFEGMKDLNNDELNAFLKSYSISSTYYLNMIESTLYFNNRTLYYLLKEFYVKYLSEFLMENFSRTE